MKRTLAGLITALGLLAGTASALAASAPPPGTADDSTIKACADFSTNPQSQGVYDPTTGIANIQIVLADYSCKNVAYSLTAVGTSSTGSTEIFQTSWQGDGQNNVFNFSHTFSSAVTSVCAWAETTGNKGALDRAPESNCFTLPTPAGPSGGVGWD